jgi:hypothetical protein
MDGFIDSTKHSSIDSAGVIQHEDATLPKRFAHPGVGLPLQQKRDWPVIEFHNRMMLGFASSWRTVSNTVSENEHVAVLPDASVAVHDTVVDPTGKHEPAGTSDSHGLRIVNRYSEVARWSPRNTHRRCA